MFSDVRKTFLQGIGRDRAINLRRHLQTRNRLPNGLSLPHLRKREGLQPPFEKTMFARLTVPFHPALARTEFGLTA